MDFEGPQETSTENQKFSQRVEINGIKIFCEWDSEYGDYTVYFPQIKLDEKARDNRVDDQLIRISEEREDAEKVFEFVSKLAETEPDVYILYRKTEDYIREMMR